MTASGQTRSFACSSGRSLSLDEYLKATGRQPGQFLFPGRGKTDRNMTTRQYARLLSEWLTGIGLDALLRNAFLEADKSDLNL